MHGGRGKGCIHGISGGPRRLPRQNPNGKGMIALGVVDGPLQNEDAGGENRDVGDQPDDEVDAPVHVEDLVVRAAAVA